MGNLGCFMGDVILKWDYGKFNIKNLMGGIMSFMSSDSLLYLGIDIWLLWVMSNLSEKVKGSLSFLVDIFIKNFLINILNFLIY